MSYEVLARKWRPQSFADVVGQQHVVTTLQNQISTGRVGHAYLFWGPRGTGKTTVARVLAKAVNCATNVEKNDPEPCNRCVNCQEISSGRSFDVREMDAASKTGIDDIRELIENSKYSPTSAKYKIFIIDEVHMLSKQAFNGLLKTLEEPPPSLKFILATTEVRKIPVTILSRCQRFDLKRVSIDQLCKHLKMISDKEKGKISDDAIKLISRTSEGSVRDSISLLDRALISQSINDNKQVEETDVRQMLGLADKSKIISLFKEVLSGKEKESLKLLDELMNDGLDAKNFLNDILEVLYLFSRRINLGPIEKDMSISEAELKMVDQYSKNIDMQDIGLFWQLTIKTIDDLRIVGNENLTLEMYIMQLVHLKNIDARKETQNLENNQQYDESLVGKKIDDKPLETNIPNQAKNQLKNTDQVKTNPVKNLLKDNQSSKIEITSFQDLIDQANKEKEIELKYDLERNVKLVSFNKGTIDISFNEQLNKNFIKNLSEKLLLWTGERWIISLSKNAEAKSIYEKNLEDKSNKVEKFEKSKIAQDIQKAFPDAKLIDFKEEE